MDSSWTVEIDRRRKKAKSKAKGKARKAAQAIAAMHHSRAAEHTVAPHRRRTREEKRADKEAQQGQAEVQTIVREGSGGPFGPALDGDCTPQ